MADASAAAKAPAAKGKAPAKGKDAAAAPKAAKPTPPKREPKYRPDAKITLLADKDGKTYGKAHNPKRAGSASAERFALYKNGMTVKQYTEAGGQYADIDYDVGHKYISVAAA